MTTNPARSWTRIDGVDLLRGLSIIFVLMNHVNVRLRLAKVPYTDGLPKQLVNSLIYNAQFGVQIFFVVSGFLITSITLRRWGSLSRIGVRDFYRLRFARIAPLLLLLLTVLSALHFAHFKDFVVQPKTGGLGRALLAALTFHVNLLEARRGYLPGNWDILWSLSVEELFYLFFPLVCMLFGRGKLLVAFLFAFVVVGPFGRTVLTHGNGIWEDYSYLGRTDAISLGCLTAMVVSRTRFSLRVLRTLAIAGLAMLIFILGFSVRAYSWGLDRYGLVMTILGVGTSMVIAAAAQTGWKSPRLLSPLLKIGQCSYEIYLTHMFVVFALFDMFVSLGKPMRAVPALFIAVILIASVFGELVSQYYSEPMNRFLRKRSGDEPIGSAISNESAAPKQKLTG